MKPILPKKAKKEVTEEVRQPTDAVIVLLTLTLVVGFGAALKQVNIISMGMIILTFLIMMIPRTVRRYANMELPLIIEIYAVIFVYASIFLGTLQGYYDKYWWWDLALHSTSALFFGLGGFIILLGVFKEEKIKASPKTIAMFTFAFALSIGALWEIIEFTLDNIQGGTYWQDGSLFDTMTDLIVDAIGGFVSSLAGYLYLTRKEKQVPFKSLVYLFKRKK